MKAPNFAALTFSMVLFLVLNAFMLSGVLWFASPRGLRETVLDHSVSVLRARSGDDSWSVMHAALEHLRLSPKRPLYTDLFFDRHYRFQYPPSALFSLMAMRWAGPDRVRTSDFMRFRPLPSINDIVGWVFILLTAASTAAVLEIRLRQRNAFPDTRGLIALRALVVAGLTLTFYPVVKAFTLGQIQVWLNALFAVSLLCWVTNRKALGGFVIGLMCLVKPFYGLIFVWGLLRREWRFVIAGAAIISAGLAASVAAFGWNNHIDYLRVITFLSQHGESYFANQSVNGVLNRLMGVAHPHEYLNLIILAGKYPPFNPWVYGGTLLSSAVILAAAFLHSGKEGDPDRTFDYCRMALSCSLASPIAWEHHYGILLPIFAVLLPRSMQARGRMIWLVVSYVLASTYFAAAKLLAPTVLNVGQSYLLVAALIALAMLHFPPTAAPAAVPQPASHAKSPALAP